MVDENNWKSLNTYEKIQHKDWKARLEGYVEAIKEIEGVTNVKDSIYNQYLKYIKIMILDTNSVCLEKALLFILKYFQEASMSISIKVVHDVCLTIINKCLNSNRQKTKELCFEIMKVIIENEQHNIVMEELLKSIKSGVPKIITASILMIKETINEFGPDIVPMNEIIKIIPKLMEDRDKNIREGCKDLIIEIYRWLDNSIINAIVTSIKPIQMKLLNNEFDKLPLGKPNATRFLKSQKPKPAPVISANVEQIVLDIVDKSHLTDPIEVISKIPFDFYEKMEEKKWTDRKDALELIDKLTSHEKLVPGDYGELVKALLKVVAKDSNIVLVALGGKIVYQIAKGLHKKYFPYALNTIQVCLEKFKEKKISVVKVLRDAIDWAFAATTLDACLDDVTCALDHKSPNVRSETLFFLNRVFEKSSPETLSIKLLKHLMPRLTKLCMDSVPEVRNASFQAIGTAMKVVSEKKIQPFLDKMDNIKIARIKEFYEKAKAGPTNVVAIDIPTIVNALKVLPNQSEQLPLHPIEVFSKDIVVVEDVETNGDHKRKEIVSTNVTLLKEKGQSTNLNPKESEESFDEPVFNPEDTSDVTNINCVKNENTADENYFDKSISHVKEEIFHLDILTCNKNSPFYKIKENSKVPSQELINNYFWLDKFDHKFEQLNKIRIQLMNDFTKLVINNIHNNNLVESYFASYYLNSIISDKFEIITEYGAFILVVVCKQIAYLASRLSTTNPDVINLVKALRNVFYHLSQIVQCDSLMNKLDDELIVIASLTLLNLSSCDKLTIMSESDIVMKWIEGAAIQIYKITINRSFTNLIKTIILKIRNPHLIELDIASKIDIASSLNDLYHRYILASSS